MVDWDEIPDSCCPDVGYIVLSYVIYAFVVASAILKREAGLLKLCTKEIIQYNYYMLIFYTLYALGVIF